MIATWMLYGTLVALLAAVSAAALEGASRLIGRAGRWWWVGAMVATFALPVVAWMQPVRPMPAVAPPTRVETDVDMSKLVAVRVPMVDTPQIGPFDWSRLDRPLAYGWALCSLALIGWFGVGAWRLRRMRRSWRPDGDLLVSEAVGPAVVGFFRCCVVVPEWSLTLGAEQRQLLLAHEAEHLAAYDSRLLWSAAALLAVVPWNPGFWWQFRRLRLAIELDCDQRVLQKRPDTATYGRLLLEVGARVTRTILPVTAFYEPMSSLERRIRSMTAKRPRGAGILATALILGAVTAMISAYVAPRPSVPARVPPPVQADSFLAQRWVHEVLAKHYGELLERSQDAAGLKLWVLADSGGRVFEHIAEEHADHPGVGSGDLQRLFPGLPSDAVVATHSGEVVGFPRKGVQLVWGTVGNSPAVKEWMEREGTRAEAEAREGREAEKREHGEGEGEARERKEAERREHASASESADEEARRKLREAAAKYYPQYLTQHANPPVVLWFNEGPGDGALQHEQTLRTPGEGVGPVPVDMGGGGLFKGWLTIGSIAEHRPDVTLVWVHHGRPPQENSESH